MVVKCAWCGEVAEPLIGGDEPEKVSHTLCPKCAVKVQTDLKESRGD